MHELADGLLVQVAYLRSSCRVLCRASSNELRIPVVDKLVVDAHVLGLCQDSIIRLEAIFLEELLISVVTSAAND